jgi:hypothetical protein
MLASVIFLISEVTGMVIAICKGVSLSSEEEIIQIISNTYCEEGSDLNVHKRLCLCSQCFSCSLPYSFFISIKNDIYA